MKEIKHKKIDNIIFDFDCTILDSHDFIIEKNIEFVKEFDIKGVDFSKIEEYKNTPIKELAKQFDIPLRKLPKLAKKYRKEFIKEMESINPINNIGSILKELKENNKTLGIITNNTEEAVEKFLIKNKMLREMITEIRMKIQAE